MDSLSEASMDGQGHRCRPSVGEGECACGVLRFDPTSCGDDGHRQLETRQGELYQELHERPGPCSGWIVLDCGNFFVRSSWRQPALFLVHASHRSDLAASNANAPGIDARARNNANSRYLYSDVTDSHISTMIKHSQGSPWRSSMKYKSDRVAR